MSDLCPCACVPPREGAPGVGLSLGQELDWQGVMIQAARDCMAQGLDPSAAQAQQAHALAEAAYTSLLAEYVPLYEKVYGEEEPARALGLPGLSCVPEGKYSQPFLLQ